MSVLGKLLELRALTTQSVFSRDLDLLNLVSRSESGVLINQTTAIRDAAIWACISLLAGDISGLPVGAFRRVGDIRQPLPNPTWMDRPDPADPTVTWTDHISSVSISLLLDGNAFILAEPTVLNAERLEALDPTTVQMRKEGRAPVYDIRFKDKSTRLTPLNIVHVPLFRRPGVMRGISPIDEHAEAIGLSRAAENYSARFFGSGATMAGFIKTPAGVDYTEDDIKTMQDSFSKTHGGWKKSYALGVLTGGADWVQTSFNPKDSQLTELRAYQVEEMARIYGIPPHMVGSQQPGAVAYASVEQRSIDYVTHTLQRYLAPLEDAYSRLIPGDARLSVPGSNTYLKFNVNGLLRGDATSRATFYKSMFEIGAFSPDDILRFEDLAPVPDGRGSEHFYPANYVSLPRPGQMAPTPNDGTAVPAGTAAGSASADVVTETRTDPWDVVAEFARASRPPEPDPAVLRMAESIMAFATRAVPAPVINVGASPVTVTPPNVNVAPAVVNVEPAQVTVNIPAGRKVIERDAQQRIVGMHEEPD